MRNWILENRLANLIRGERRYNVKGNIVFEIGHGCHNMELDLQQLAAAIREVDAMFPWHDDDIDSKMNHKSLFYLSGGRVVVHDLNGPLKMVWFDLFTEYRDIRRSQVYAYEKYLAKLAEELAKKKFVGIAEVTSAIEVRTSRHFRVN
ncbi:MAG: hypothetical protein KGJ89_03015 [Patescibacteria group bacterium]|nr:hypothetical protein [Patescibacteria group bacterium]MDE2015479.1 hypothetical protein [Patescibacteria group bacterium]MDE2226905.1 hypothetical protein [Patescibacteria group bacterium]